METRMRSEEVRQKWAETVDRAYAEKEEVVIMRHGRPIVTLVNHAAWQKTKKRLLELEAVLRAKQVEREIEEDPISSCLPGAIRRNTHPSWFSNHLKDSGLAL